MKDSVAIPILVLFGFNFQGTEMNELTEKIYGEACIAAGNLDEREFCEKFAQLIVKKCCAIVNQNRQHNNPNDCLLVLDIKEHFGIEE